MTPELLIQQAFPLTQLKKIAAGIPGISDLGKIESVTSPLPQARAAQNRMSRQTKAVNKAAPPPVVRTHQEAPKPLDISMPKMAAVRKLQLLLTKNAWEVGDDRGAYSDKPLRYTNAKAPRQTTLENPAKLREYATRAIQQALKKLPEQQQLHWINPETVVGQRSWYNPMRYAAGKDVLDEKEYTLGKGSTKKDIADIVALMQIGSEDQSPLMAYRPQKYANLVQPPNNYRLLPTAPNITTTTPAQRSQNLHADKTDGNGLGGNLNPGSARINSVIDDIGAISTSGNINGNASQSTRTGGMKIAAQKLAKLLAKTVR